MALNKGFWDLKLRGTNIKGTNFKSLKEGQSKLKPLLAAHRVRASRERTNGKVYGSTFGGLGLVRNAGAEKTIEIGFLLNFTCGQLLGLTA